MFEGLKRIWTRAKRDGIKATLVSELFGGLLKGIEGVKLFDYTSYLEAGSRKCWALYKATDIVAKTAMDTPLRLQKRGGDGKPVNHRELLALLAVPNTHQTWSELSYMTAGHLMLTGNAFWLKDEVNFQNERPGKLWPLNPKRMRIVIDNNRGIAGYIYRVEGIGSEVPLEVSEIVHHKVPHVNNDYWGLGVVEAGEDLFQSFLNRQAFENRFWKNGASPTGVLICEDQIANVGAWEELKQKWHAQYGGVDNSGKTAWLTGKWRYEKLGLSNVEMQNIEGSRWTIEQIFMQCGVPLSVAGLKDAANYATARQDDLRFRRYTVKPYLTLIQETITSDVVAGFDPNLEVVFEIAGLVDLDNLRENFVPLFDRGAMSINELRQMAGLMPDPNNDEWNQHYINAGLVPLSLSGVALDSSAEEAKRITNRFMQRSLLPAPSQNGNGTHASAR